MLVGVHDAVAGIAGPGARAGGTAGSAGGRHWHDLPCERAAALRGDRAFVRAQRQRVLLVPGDRVLPAHVLGRLQHPSRHRMIDPAGVHARPFETILELESPGLHAPAWPGRVELGLAHAVDAARQHQLGGAGAHLHTPVQNRLQPRAAAPVDLQAGHLHGQPGVERGHAADRRRLAACVALPHDHVVDVLAVQPRAADELGDHRRGERRRADVA